VKKLNLALIVLCVFTVLPSTHAFGQDSDESVKLNAHPGMPANFYGYDWTGSDIIGENDIEIGGSEAHSLEERRSGQRLVEQDYLNDQKNLFKQKAMLNAEFSKKQAVFTQLASQIQALKDKTKDPAKFTQISDQFDSVSESYSTYVGAYAKKFAALQKQEWENRGSLAKLGPKTEEGKRQAMMMTSKTAKIAKLDAKDQIIVSLRKQLSKCQNPPGSGSAFSAAEKKPGVGRNIDAIRASLPVEAPSAH
jgi:hypothetical protein